MDPKIYLAIDNCFASKRWTQPREWMRVIRELGLTGIEASADTECDPLYMGEEFTRDWIKDVKRQCAQTGCVVRNVYSGHGTYATSGLSHYDRRVTERFRDAWMKAQMDTARALGAGFGFFAHGFDETLLQDDALYAAKLDELYDTLAELARYANQTGVRYVGIEQMYSPHQPPWTLDGMRELFQEVCRRAGAPFYVTLDLGHMNGQQYFFRPTADQVRAWIGEAQRGTPRRRVWLGSEKAHALYQAAIAKEMAEDEAAEMIMEDIAQHPHLFSQPCDWSIREWVRNFGCYSPIMHLQQTDGKSSPHWPFSKEFNAMGVVDAREVFAALGEAFARPDEGGMPPKCGEVVMTLEPFIGTAGNTYDLRSDLDISVRYWREWIPRDGMPLSEILKSRGLV